MLVKIFPVFSIIFSYLKPDFFYTLALIDKSSKNYVDNYTQNIGYYHYFLKKIKLLNNSFSFKKEKYLLEKKKICIKQNVPIYIVRGINIPIEISNYFQWKIVNKYYNYSGKFFVNPHINLDNNLLQIIVQEDKSIRYNQKIIFKYNTIEDKYYLTEFHLKFNKFKYIFYEPFSLTETILNLIESDNFCIQYISFIIIYFLALLLFLVGNLISIKILEIIFN